MLFGSADVHAGVEGCVNLSVEMGYRVFIIIVIVKEEIGIRILQVRMKLRFVLFGSADVHADLVQKRGLQYGGERNSNPRRRYIGAL